MTIDELMEPSSSPPSDKTIVGIGLARPSQRTQLHAALVFSSPESYDRVLHHLDHQRTTEETRTASKWPFWWVQVPLTEDLSSIFGGHFRRIHRRISEGESIKYGLLYNDAYFDRVTGALELNEASGLTCATFVLAAFAGLGERLIDTATWPVSGPANKAWQHAMHEYQMANCMTEEEADVLKSEIGAKRFKPNEVAASGTFDQRPVTQKQLKTLARQIETTILSSTQARQTADVERSG